MTTIQSELITTQIQPQKIISVRQFIILSIATFGIYPLWWNYKAWIFFQQKDQLDIIPFMRTLFSIIFLYSLFTKIETYSSEKSYLHQFSKISMFLGFLFTSILAVLPDPYWLISVCSFIFLIPAFKALNYAQKNAKELEIIEQSKFSNGHIVAITIGIIFWILVILSMWFLSLETQSL